MSASRAVERLGIAELERRLGCERTSVWRWCKAGTFPRPHYIGSRRCWFLHDIEAWEAAQMARAAGSQRGVATTAMKVEAQAVEATITTTAGCD